MSYETLKGKIEQLVDFTQLYQSFRYKFIENVGADGEVKIKIKDNAFYQAKENIWGNTVDGILALLNVTSNDIVEIGSAAFRSIVISSANFPNCVKLAGDVFQWCASLKEVNMPKVEEIGHNCFYEVPVTTLYFPLCTKLMGYMAPPKLTSLTLGALTYTKANSFSSGKSLTNLTIGAGTTASLHLQQSTLYSQETLHALIDNLADMTGDTSPTFQVGETNLAKISDEYLVKLEEKNWTYL